MPWRDFHDEGSSDSDLVTQVLEQREVPERLMESVRRALIEHFARRDPAVVLYLVPEAGDRELSGPMLAGEMAARTELGDSFVEIAIAGALLRNQSLESFLEIILGSR